LGYLLLHRLNRIIQACQKQEACRKVVERDPAETTLHHIALNISLEDFESEKMRLEGLGLKVDATVHEWLFVFARCISPTQSGVLSLSKGGNLLEFVCYDASVG